MTVRITARAPVYKGFKTGTVAKQMRKDIRLYGRKVINTLKETTENWNDDKPQFVVLKTQVAPSRSERLFIDIGVKNPNSKGAKKWRWLDQGTSIRYATMDKAFRPKTRVGTTKTGPGQPPGSPRYVSKKMPRPGIEARNWSGVTQRKHQKGRSGVQSFPNAMRVSLAKGVIKSIADMK